MSTDSQPPSDIDQRLWVRSDEFDSDGFLLGNSHTFPGRFLVWWRKYGAGYSTSLNQLDECSADAAIWLEGYLAGSEPPPWFGDDFGYDDTDPRTELWYEALRRYRRTGVWSPGRICLSCQTEIPETAPVDEDCTSHDTSHFTADGGTSWPRVVAPPK